MSKPLRKRMFPNDEEQTTALFAPCQHGCDHHAITGWNSWFTTRSNNNLGIEIGVSAHPHVCFEVEVDEHTNRALVEMDREEVAELITELESALRFADAVADHNQYGGDDA